MSEIAETARATIWVADFANVDASGKLNLLGGGVAITGIDANTGQSVPMSVVVSCQVNPKFVGQQYALELAL